MVGRYVAPLFLAPGFDVQDPQTWPRLNVDVARVVLQEPWGGEGGWSVCVYG